MEIIINSKGNDKTVIAIEYWVRESVNYFIYLQRKCIYNEREKVSFFVREPALASQPCAYVSPSMDEEVRVYVVRLFVGWLFLDYEKVFEFELVALGQEWIDSSHWTTRVMLRAEWNKNECVEWILGYELICFFRNFCQWSDTGELGLYTIFELFASWWWEEHILFTT